MSPNKGLRLKRYKSMSEEETIKEPDNTGEIRDEKGRFKPGVSGNPDGKPPGSISVVAELKKKLEEVPIDGNPEKKRYLDMLIIKVIKKALADGDVSMIKDIIDRVDGRPKQSVSMGSDSESPLQVVVTDYNDPYANLTRAEKIDKLKAMLKDWEDEEQQAKAETIDPA